MTGKRYGNTCTDLLSRIPKQLEAESIELEPGVDDRDYQVQVIKSYKLEDRPVWDSEEEEDAEVIGDPLKVPR